MGRRVLVRVLDVAFPLATLYGFGVAAGLVCSLVCDTSTDWPPISFGTWFILLGTAAVALSPLGFWMYTDCLLQATRTDDQSLRKWHHKMLWIPLTAVSYYYVMFRPRLVARNSPQRTHEMGPGSRFLIWALDVAFPLTTLLAVIVFGGVLCYASLEWPSIMVEMEAATRWILVIVAAVAPSALWLWMYVDCVLHATRTGDLSLSRWSSVLTFIPFASPVYYYAVFRPRLGGRSSPSVPTGNP
jgi:hypothetical protein